MIENILIILVGVVIGMVAYEVRKETVLRARKRREIDYYTHWDIHTLARVMDPGSWAAFDALPEVDPETGRKKNYVWFAPVRPSFDMAVHALLAGYKAPWPHIYGEEAVRARVQYITNLQQIRRLL